MIISARLHIYGLGPYIADYPEQALLACIIQGWCARWVTVVPPLWYYDVLTNSRCTAPHNDLDVGAGPCAHLLTEQLIQMLDSRTLWEEYGIVANVVVRHASVFLLANHPNCYIIHLALHCPLPPGRYPWAHCSWPIASTYQGHVQRPLGYMGRELPCEDSWRAPGASCDGGHRSQVSNWSFLTMRQWQIVWLYVESRQCHSFLDCSTSPRAMGLSSGPGMIPRHWWRWVSAVLE